MIRPQNFIRRHSSFAKNANGVLYKEMILRVPFVAQWLLNWKSPYAMGVALKKKAKKKWSSYESNVTFGHHDSFISFSLEKFLP